MRISFPRSAWASALFAGSLILAGATPSGAAPLTNWTQSNGSNGSNLSSNSPVLGNGTADSGDEQAIYSAFTGFTLNNVGDSISISGSVTFSSLSSPANDQFRIGLYDVNGKAGVTGWLGYYGTNSASNGVGQLWERDNPNIYSYGSGSGAKSVATAGATPGNGSFASGSYVFSLTATREADNSLRMLFTLTGTSLTYGLSISYLDATPQTFTFDRVGVFTGGGLNAGQVSFSDMTVTTVPEPGTLGLAALGAILFWNIRRRKM